MNMPVKKQKMGRITLWILGDEKRKIYPTDKDFKELAKKIRKDR